MENPLENLVSGDAVRGGESPRARLQQRKLQEKILAKEVAACAVEEGLVSTQEKYALSETAVAKICINRAKRDNLDLSSLIAIDRQNEIRQFIFEVHSTSVKKLLSAAEGRFTEGEVRLVRAIIQRQGNESWES